MEQDWLDKRLQEKDKRAAKDASIAEHRARGAVYAPTAYDALCADIRGILARYEKRAGDRSVAVGQTRGFLTVHRGRFPAFHLEVHPPCANPAGNLIQIKGFLRTNRQSEKEDLSGVVEVLPDNDSPGQYVLYYGCGQEAVDTTVSEQILSRIFDVLTR